MFNEQNEIRGDDIEDVRADMERTEGYEACPVKSETDEDVEAYAEDYSERMDGDHETALRDAGYGTDEDYGYFGPVEDAF